MCVFVCELLLKCIWRRRRRRAGLGWRGQGASMSRSMPSTRQQQPTLQRPSSWWSSPPSFSRTRTTPFHYTRQSQRLPQQQRQRRLRLRLPHAVEWRSSASRRRRTRFSVGLALAVWCRRTRSARGMELLRMTARRGRRLASHPSATAPPTVSLLYCAVPTLVRQ